MGSFVYTAAGKMPWHVVAYDTRTGSQKSLLTFEPADHPEVHQRGREVYLEVTRGAPKQGEPATSAFRLLDGRAEPADSVPKFDDSYVPGVDGPQPELMPFERALPIIDGGAAVSYRMAGQPAWKTAMIPVRGHDVNIERISPLPDGRLLVSTGPYGNVHIFDPKSGTFSLLGNPAEKNVYDMVALEGKIYFCGYPNSIFGEFGSDGATIIGDWHQSLKSKHAVFIVRGADGRIYSGNHNERESTGGALGWYDPRSGEFGGIHFPNDDCEFLTTALAGKIIVYASDFSLDPSHPEIKNRDGQLFFYDTGERKVVRQLAPLSSGSAGVVVETEPGQLFGFGLHDKLPVMYSVDMASGRVMGRAPLPSAAPRFIARGPDGLVYFFVKNSLVRADPKTFGIETLCPAEPGRMVFMGTDLYIAGLAKLRRIAGIGGAHGL